MNWLTELLQNDPDPPKPASGSSRCKAVIDNAKARSARHQLLEGHGRGHRRAGAHLPFSADHRIRQHHPAHLEAKSPGDAAMEWRIRSIIRWNALAMVVRANRKPGELGGHIASFASAATLYDVGFNHFWRGPSAEHPGDLLYIQGHSSPGIYARSFLEGRISESQLGQLPHGSRRPRHLLVSAPVADARLLADADGEHGPGPDLRDLPGALLEVPGRPRPDAEDRPQGVVLPRRR
jgi:pyruvate dehydrogenase E1 component